MGRYSGGSVTLDNTATLTNKTINRPDNTLTNLAIANADVSATAAIAKSKLASLAIADADVASGAAIAQSKLNLSIANAQVASNAAIAKSKLASLAIADADVASNAAIASTKISGLYTGFTTQTDQTSSRAIGTAYQNASGKPMLINVTSTCTTTSNDIFGYTDFSNPPTTQVTGTTSVLANRGVNTVMIVLPGTYYKVDVSGGVWTVYKWFEWT